MPMTAPPTAFPAPGTFAVAQQVTLLCDTPDAVIRYTLDGTPPQADSPMCLPHDLPMLAAVNDANGKGVRSTYTLTAQATAPGHAVSEVVTFDYVIDRRDTDVYVSAEVEPGLWMIKDYDDTKMYLIKGSERALLVDAGMGNGQLRAFVSDLVGDLPLSVFITHGHPDHIAAMGQFEDAYDVYMSHHDLPMAHSFKERLGYQLDLSAIIDIHEGMVFDLGDWHLEVYHVPGHSRGSMILLDAARGVVIAGDAFGSNTPTIPHALWMQIPSATPIDHYLSALYAVRAHIDGRYTRIYGGHNDTPLGPAYLDTLQAVVQKLVDMEGEALSPSLRPRGGWWAQVGDRVRDPNWAAINVAREGFLSLPSIRLATLAYLGVQGGTLEPRFGPETLTYTVQTQGDVVLTPWVTTTDYTSMTINDVPHRSGVPYVVTTPQVTIRVVAADGAVAQRYQITLVPA